MPEYDNPHDREAAVLQRLAQDDPWVMYLVVRRERVSSLQETLIAGAVASVRCVDQWRDHPAWRDAFDAWFARSFRKVCLRANERDWARLLAYDHGLAEAGATPAVLALPPRTKSQRDKLIVHLQAFTDAAFAPPPPPPAPAFSLRLARNDDLAMSAGKAVAQVAHAALHACGAFGATHAGAFARWRALGMPCDLRAARGSAWAALKREEPVAVVRDAGLTEVAPGSETFLAMPPAEPEAWSAAWRALPALTPA